MNDVLYKFKFKNFKASKLSTYDFSTLYTTLPNHLIKDKLIDLINRTFIRENIQYLACNEESAFFHFWCIQELQFMVLSKSLRCPCLSFG